MSPDRVTVSLFEGCDRFGEVVAQSADQGVEVRSMNALLRWRGEAVAEPAAHVVPRYELVQVVKRLARGQISFFEAVERVRQADVEQRRVRSGVPPTTMSRRPVVAPQRTVGPAPAAGAFVVTEDVLNRLLTGTAREKTVYRDDEGRITKVVETMSRVDRVTE